MTETPPRMRKEPVYGTSALREYLWASACDMRLFHFTIDVVLRADYSSYVVKQALAGATGYKETTPAQLAKENPGRMTIALRQSSQELLEMFLCRAVDNFQVYLVDVIRLALHKQPRILSERKQELTLGHILKFESIEALTRDIVEAKIGALSYEGFGDLEAWCLSKALPLVIPDGERGRVVDLVASRNIIVHSRGVVDERYKAAVPSSPILAGDKRTLTVDDLLGAHDLLDRIAKLTDVAIAGKFGLEEHNVREEISRRSKVRWPRPTPDVTPLEDPPAISGTVEPG